ncbi:MAG: hypothetical protein AAGA53_00040 [Pseudomonadota bacterium]
MEPNSLIRPRSPEHGNSQDKSRKRQKLGVPNEARRKYELVRLNAAKNLGLAVRKLNRVLAEPPYKIEGNRWNPDELAYLNESYRSFRGLDAIIDYTTDQVINSYLDLIVREPEALPAYEKEKYLPDSIKNGLEGVSEAVSHLTPQGRDGLAKRSRILDLVEESFVPEDELETANPDRIQMQNALQNFIRPGSVSRNGIDNGYGEEPPHQPEETPQSIAGKLNPGILTSEDRAMGELPGLLRQRENGKPADFPKLVTDLDVQNIAERIYDARMAIRDYVSDPQGLEREPAVTQRGGNVPQEGARNRDPDQTVTAAGASDQHARQNLIPERLDERSRSRGDGASI